MVLRTVGGLTDVQIGRPKIPITAFFDKIAKTLAAKNSRPIAAELNFFVQTSTFLRAWPKQSLAY